MAGRLVGLAHDLGKYSAEFQSYIKSATGLLDPDQDKDWVDATSRKGKIDHSTAGAQWIWQALRLDHPPRDSEEYAQHAAAQMLALVVASHHSGLIDCIAAGVQSVGQDQYGRRLGKHERDTHLPEVRTAIDADVLQRLQELLKSSELLASLKILLQRIASTEKAAADSPTIKNNKLGLVTRFLLSCLVEGDHRNSADHEMPQAASLRPQGTPDWATLIERLEQHLQKFSASKSIDRIRADISAHCLAAAARERGIYTLTVPTGGGKTLASLRFALHHAQKHGLDRIIYAIPFSSIIDQNAAVARGILEPKGVAAGSVLLEHHSNLLPEDLTWQHKRLSENWDVPVVYTTSVQLLEALFGGGTRNVRRMHALARSVLIFDEVQTLPLKCAHLFANALNFLVEQAGSSVVLCTATQPLLHGIDAHKGAVRLAENPELMPDVGQLFAALKRTDVIDMRRPGGWCFDDAATQGLKTQRAHGSTLFVVNTKRAARELFLRCRSSADMPVYHLSTGMCPAHRRTILAELRGKLERREPLICISTQLIEAGVDLSFGSVIRSQAGLDSIAQAAGRCNRHGEQATAPVLVINLADERVDLLTEIATGQQVSERLFDEYAKAPAAFQHNLLAENAMRQYFDYYFFQRADCMSYPIQLYDLKYHEKAPDTTLLSLLSGNEQAVNTYKKRMQKAPPYLLRQAFCTAARAFQVIDAPTQGVVVPYGLEGKSVVAELNGDLHPKQLGAALRRAQQFSINLYENNIKELQEAGALYRTPSDIWCLRPLHYHDDVGISTEPRPLTREEIKETILQS